MREVRRSKRLAAAQMDRNGSPVAKTLDDGFDGLDGFDGFDSPTIFVSWQGRAAVADDGQDRGWYVDRAGSKPSPPPIVRQTAFLVIDHHD